MVNPVNTKSAIEYSSSLSRKCSTKRPWMWGPLLEVLVWEVDDGASWDRARGTHVLLHQEEWITMPSWPTLGETACVSDWYWLEPLQRPVQPGEIRGKEQAWPLTTYPADAKLSLNQHPWQKLRRTEGRKTKDKETVPASLEPLVHPIRTGMDTVCQDYCRCFSSSIIIREVIWSGDYSYPHDPDDDHRH